MATVQTTKTKLEFLQKLAELATRAIKLAEEGLVASGDYHPFLAESNTPRDPNNRVLEVIRLEHELKALELEYRQLYGGEDEAELEQIFDPPYEDLRRQAKHAEGECVPCDAERGLASRSSVPCSNCSYMAFVTKTGTLCTKCGHFEPDEITLQEGETTTLDGVRYTAGHNELIVELPEDYDECAVMTAIETIAAANDLIYLRLYGNKHMAGDIPDIEATMMQTEDDCSDDPSC